MKSKNKHILLCNYDKLLNIKVAERFIKYFFVGGSAAIIEWIVFYCSTRRFHSHYIFATAVAFIIATFYNYLLGRKFVFTKKIAQKVKYDIFKVYLVSTCGLFINFILMWVFVDNLGLDSMLSKIMATGIAFSWNFASRQFFIYKPQ